MPLQFPRCPEILSRSSNSKIPNIGWHRNRAVFYLTPETGDSKNLMPYDSFNYKMLSYRRETAPQGAL